MKVLYHHRTRADDGQAVHIRALQEAFREEGHEVREVGLVQQGSGEPGAAPPSDAGRGWGWVSRLPRFALELAEYAYTVPAKRRILRAAAEFRPDFLYERYAFGNAGGAQAASRLGLPFVLEVNSPMVLELGRTRGLSFPRTAARLERAIFRAATRVCVVTRVLGDILVDIGVDPERLLVTPNGVHLELYDHGDRPAVRAAACRELGLGPGGPETVTLGFVGYYRDWHRLDLAIAALRRPELSHARLAIVGEGPAHDELVAAAEGAGVRDRVHFCGKRPHRRIPDLLTAFDVALVPAINPYASPLKLHEYMAAGLCVVAPDQPNLREVLVPGENGLLVAPGEAEALEAALVAAAEDAAFRASLGAAARRTIEERDLTWRGNARRVVEAVEGARR